MCREPASEIDLVGLLNIHKPCGVSSRHVVDQVLNHLKSQTGKAVKVGHSGTLDPYADGVLVLGIGNATTLLQVLQQADKRYLAKFQLGKFSDSYDLESPLQDVPIPQPITRENLQSIMAQFTGVIQQVPPKHSAVKIRGRRAYKLVREGRDFAVPTRTVYIHELKLVDFQNDQFEMEVQCSGGTYIRTLGRDIALKLGTDAVMTSLTRTSSCGISVEDALDLGQLLNRPIESSDLLSPFDAMRNLPSIEIPAEEHLRFAKGLISHRVVQNLNQRFPCNRPTQKQPAALVHRHELAGIVYWRPDSPQNENSHVTTEANPESGEWRTGEWRTWVNFAKFKYR